MSGKECVGFGEFEGKCKNKVNQAINPIWCERCDRLRIKHIDKQFGEIMKGFDNV